MIGLIHIRRVIPVALLLMGSAILLISCDGKKDAEEDNLEKLMTMKSDTLTVINTSEGRKTYRFTTPLMERYEYAKEPYMEFRRGGEIEFYNDSTQIVESSIKADYAIYWEKRELWEARGNVLGLKDDGTILETQQLFWNQRAKKFYSNVDTRVTQPGGERVTGVGFESDESLENLEMRRSRGKILVDAEPTREEPDSIQQILPNPSGTKQSPDEGQWNRPNDRRRRMNREPEIELIRVRPEKKEESK